MSINPKPPADSSAELFITNKDCYLRDLCATLLAGSFVDIVVGHHIKVTGQIRDDDGDITSVNAKEVSVEAMRVLYRPEIIERYVETGPARVRKAPIRYVGGHRLFEIKRNARIPSHGCVLLGNAHIGVTDGRWFAHGFCEDCRVLYDETISEDEAKYALNEAGYRDVTEPARRNPANYPRPRTAKRQRCKNSGQASMLDAMGVSDDR